jgi:glycosyltransferase involved in cell wall biosynthesis
MTKSITISACLMVKNEERNLPRCLDSIVDLVDEIIVVDTGSTDPTVDIAARYGAKIYHSPWRDDFSFHRNESIGHATGDWILRIDADEEMVTTFDSAGLHNLLASLPDNCNATRNIMEDIQSGQVAAMFPQLHFFRKGGVKFVNRKHNMPVFEGPVYTLKGVLTRHYGYDKELSQGKAERDMKLLEIMREEDPDNPKLDLWFAKIYSHYFKDYRRALKHISKYIMQHSKEKGFNPSAYVMGWKIAKASKMEKAAQWLYKTGFDEKSVDMCFVKIQIGCDTKNSDMIEDGCRQYLKAYDMMVKRPDKMDGRFLYHADFDALAFVLHKAAACHLHRGFGYLNKFYQYLPKASPEAAEKLKSFMDYDLAQIGFIKPKVRAA